MTEQNNLVEKLSLQAESFQEAFETLSKASSFKELSNNFYHLLRGNFLIKDIYLFHKTNQKSEWKNSGKLNELEDKYLSYLSIHSATNINYHEDEKISTSVILPLSDSSYLGILLGQKLDNSAFNDFDKITLLILLQVFNSAHKAYLNRLKEKKLIFDLNEKVFQLNHLIDTGIELSRFEKRSILYELALERVSSLTNSSSAIIKVEDKENNSENYFSFPYGIKYNEIVNSKYKTQTSFELFGKTYTFILSGKETRLGLTNFNELDTLLFEAVTRQVSAAIENEFLHQEAIDKKLIEQEINVAASIQHRIIPDKLPAIKGYEIAGINIPSKEVSGDYYDLIELKSGKFAFIIADVTGKGISASLLVNTLNASLYAYLEFNLPLTEMVERLNKLIFRSSPADKFITFFIAVLDPDSGELDMVNAGHNPILVLRNSGDMEKIDAGGIGLGMLDLGLPYAGQKLKLEKGDRIFLYTDGIPEAMNENEEEYSDERMINFLKNNNEKSTNDFVNDLVGDIKSHVGTAHQSDDITILVVNKI